MSNFTGEHAWASSLGRVAWAGAVTVAFAAMARMLRGVNRSGMVAGALTCFLLFAEVGPSAFAVLVTLFALTWAATRLGYRRKVALGVAERRGGRTARQVLANVGVATVSSVLYAMTGNSALIVAMAAALAEAAADTVASEIGQLRGGRARLITTWEPVAAGTDGGITLAGSLAGAVAASSLAAVCLAGRLLSPHQVWIPAAAGFAGMLIDSLLGATAEGRGWIGNEAVNFLSTLCAAAIALLVAR
jgi:uncharacterized protein (TIGR00297 family)